MANIEKFSITKNQNGSVTLTVEEVLGVVEAKIEARGCGYSQGDTIHFPSIEAAISVSNEGIKEIAANYCPDCRDGENETKSSAPASPHQQPPAHKVSESAD